MAPVERGLVACVAVDRGHDAALDADFVVQNLCEGRKAIGGAGPVGDHALARLQGTVVDAVDHGAVDVAGWRRDQDFFGPLAQVHVGAVAVVEFAGAFETPVAAGPVEFFWIIGRHHVNGPAPKVHGVARDGDRAAKAAMDAVVF